MTETRRELIFGILGLGILAVVAFVLVTQASDDVPPTAPTDASGAPLAVDVGAPTPTPQITPSPTPNATPTPTPNPQTYTVQAGDTLLAIAQRFNISVEDLAARNEILDPNNVFAGQRLELPQPGERVTGSGQPATDKAIYVVQAGDTLYAIAQELEVSVEDLAEANEITDPTQLFVGRRLTVPERRLTPPTPRPTP